MLDILKAISQTEGIDCYKQVIDHLETFFSLIKQGFFQGTILSVLLKGWRTRMQTKRSR